MDSIKAPWTPKQVAALNRFQSYGFVHEYTCPSMHRVQCECVAANGGAPKETCPRCVGGGWKMVSRALAATPDGWLCLHCAYKQNWAHAMSFMPWIGPPDWKCPECGSEEPERSPLHIGICSKCGVSDPLPKK